MTSGSSVALGIPGTKLTTTPATSSTIGYGARSLRARAPNATTTRSSSTNTSCEAWTPPTSMVPLRRHRMLPGDLSTTVCRDAREGSPNQETIPPAAQTADVASRDPRSAPRKGAPPVAVETFPTAGRSAIPSNPATRATALFTAEAIPASLSSAALITAEVRGATVSERPTANAHIPASSQGRLRANSPACAAIASPAPEHSGPIVIGTRYPLRCASLPASGESTSMIAESGSRIRLDPRGPYPRPRCSPGTKRDIAPEDPEDINDV